MDSEYDPPNLPFFTLVKEYLAIEENKIANEMKDVQRNHRNSFTNGDGRMLDLTVSIRGELDESSVNSSGTSSGKRIRKRKSKLSNSKQRLRYEVDLCDKKPLQKKRTGERKSKPRSIPTEETSQKKTGRKPCKIISEDIAFTESPLENMRQESLASGKQHLKVGDQGEPNQMSQPTNSAQSSRKSKPRKKANPELILHEGKTCLQRERKCGEWVLENDDVNQSPRSTTRKKSVQVFVVHNEEDLKRVPRRLEPMPKQRNSRSDKKRRPASEKRRPKKKTPQQEISNSADVAGRQNLVKKSQSDISASVALIPKIEQLGSCEYTRYPSPPRHKPNNEPRRNVKYRILGHEDNACLQQNGGRDISIEGIKYRSQSVPKDVHLSRGDLLKQSPSPQQVEPIAVHSLGSEMGDMQAKKEMRREKIRKISKVPKQDQRQVETVEQLELKDVSLNPSANSQQDKHDQSHVEIVKQLEQKDVSGKSSGNAQQHPHTEPNIKLSTKDSSGNSSKKIKKRRKLPRQDLQNSETFENSGLTYVSPKPCRNAPQAEPDQKLEDKACISDSSTNKIKDLQDFETLETSKTSEQADEGLEGSDLVLEEIAQDMEESITELDRKCSDKVCVSDSSIKKAKSLTNLKARDTQDTPKMGDKVFKDSDLILEEITQVMEANPGDELSQKSKQKVYIGNPPMKEIKNLPNFETRNTQETPKPVDIVLKDSDLVLEDECNSWDLSDDECEDLTKLPELMVARTKKFEPKQDKADKKSKADVDDDNFSELLKSIEEKLRRKTQPKEQNTAESRVESKTGVSNDVADVNVVSEEGCDKGNNSGSYSPEQDASDTDLFDISDILKSDDEPKMTKNKALEKRDNEMDSQDSEKQRGPDKEIPKGEATILGILEFQMKMKGARGLRLEKMQERYQELVCEYKEIVNKKKQPDKESLCSWSSAISKDTTTDDDTDDQLCWSEPELAKPITIQDIVDAKSSTRGRYGPVFERMETNCKTIYMSQSDLSLEGDTFENTTSHKHAKESESKNEGKYQSMSGKYLKKALKKTLKKINHSEKSLKTRQEREFLKYQEKSEKKEERRLKKMNREERKAGRRKVEEFLRAQDKEDKKKMRVEQEIEKEKAIEQKKRERKERKERRKQEKEMKKELEEKREAEKEQRERKERIEKAAARRRKEREKKESEVDEESESKHIEIHQSLCRMEKKLIRQEKRRSKVPVEWLGLTDGSRSKKKLNGRNRKECSRPQDPNSSCRAWEWSKDSVLRSNTEVSYTPVEPLKVFEHGEFEERLIATIKTGIKFVIAKQMLYSQGRKYKKSYASKHSSRDYYHTRLNIDIPSNVLKCSERMKLHDFLKTCDKCKTGALEGWSMLWDYNAWFYPNIPGSTCKIVPDIDIKSAIKKTKLSIDEYAVVTAAKVMKGLHEATVT